MNVGFKRTYVFASLTVLIPTRKSNVKVNITKKSCDTSFSSSTASSWCQGKFNKCVIIFRKGLVKHYLGGLQQEVVLKGLCHHMGSTA